MAFSEVSNTLFSDYSNTADPGDGNTLVNGLKSYGGFSIVSGKARVTSITFAGQSFLLRQSSEGSLTQKAILDFPVIDWTATHCDVGICLRKNPADNYFLAACIRSGGDQFMLRGYGPSGDDYDIQGVTMDSSHTHSIEFSAVDSSPTVCRAILRDTTTDTILKTIDKEFASDWTNATFTPGIFVAEDPGDVHDTINFARFRTYVDVTGIVPGTLTVESVSTTEAVLNWGGAIGGTGALTAELHRGDTPNFTPDGTTKLADVEADGSDFPYTDSTWPNVRKFYKVVVTDSVDTVANTWPLLVYAVRPPMKLLWIGDSITIDSYHGGSGGAGSPPDYANTELLTIRGYQDVTYVNSAVSGAGVHPTNWESILQAGYDAGCRIVIFNALGTNNAKISVATSDEDYETNYAIMLQQALTIGFEKCILNDCIYPHPPGLSNDWPPEANDRVLGFNVIKSSLCNGTTILEGDKYAYDYTSQHPELFEDQIHPKDSLNAILGRQFWAQAIDQALNISTDPGIYATVATIVPA